MSDQFIGHMQSMEAERRAFEMSRINASARAFVDQNTIASMPPVVPNNLPQWEASKARLQELIDEQQSAIDKWKGLMCANGVTAFAASLVLPFERSVKFTPNVYTLGAIGAYREEAISMLRPDQSKVDILLGLVPLFGTSDLCPASAHALYMRLQQQRTQRELAELEAAGPPPPDPFASQVAVRQADAMRHMVDAQVLRQLKAMQPDPVQIDALVGARPTTAVPRPEVTPPAKVLVGTPITPKRSLFDWFK